MPISSIPVAVWEVEVEQAEYLWHGADDDCRSIFPGATSRTQAGGTVRGTTTFAECDGCGAYLLDDEDD